MTIGFHQLYVSNVGGLVYIIIQGSEVLSMLYAAHQEGKKTTGVDIEVSLLTDFNILAYSPM